MRPELRWAYIVDSLINNHDHHVEPISFMSCEANNRSLQQREKSCILYTSCEILAAFVK